MLMIRKGDLWVIERYGWKELKRGRLFCLTCCGVVSGGKMHALWPVIKRAGLGALFHR